MKFEEPASDEMKKALEKAVHKFSIIFQDQVDREVEYTETIGEAIQRFLKILPEDLDT